MVSNTSFSIFCGGQFWDTALTWEGPNPQFTLCFQWTALIWVPCAFLWLLLLPYIHYLRGLRQNQNGWNTLNILKTIFGCLLLVTTVCDLVKGVVDFVDDTSPAVYVVSPVVLLVTLILSLVLLQYERKKGLCTSGVLFLFHLFLVIAGIVPFYMKIIDPVGQGASHDLYRFITFYVYYGFLLVQFILLCFAERVPQESLSHEKEPCPKLSASFLSRITFSWVTRLVYNGYKKVVEEKDMFAPVPDYLTRNVYPKFDKMWRKEVGIPEQETKYSALLNGVYDTSNGVTGKYDEKTPLIQPQWSRDTSRPKSLPQKRSAFALFKVIVVVFGPYMIQGHICKIVYDVLTFVGPQLQGALITYTQDPTVEEWKGYFYASMFLVVNMINSIFFNQMFYIGRTAGMKIKVSVVTAIYRKALTLSNEARRNATVGEIVNLMSVDAQRLQECTRWLWMIWSAPIQISLSVYFLWGILGPSVLSGLALMLILIPINVVLASFQRKFQIAQMKQKDYRIKLMNEILSGIKVLKLYAWELSFKDKVNKIRNFELKLIMKAAYLNAIASFTFTCAPFLVTLTCFATYTLTGGVLDANKAFVSLSLFNILRMPLNMLPQVITQLIVASVSIQRISRFLQLPDIDQDNVSHNQKSDHPISVKNGTFTWGDRDYESSILNNITMHVDEGALVAVVGQVGCGKSSLIAAILGEMEKVKGDVNIRGSVAYVAQEAWIQNKSLRDNILFGSKMDHAKYDNVLEACALVPDLEILPNGDLTEIGEKGINLSGGQKQRVSLARAVYRDADVYLLDDPLSAVDSRVGKHIYEKVVNGLLKNKTRVLVTHGVHWLPSVDKIVVMVGGSVTETGSYQQLLSHDGDFAQFLKTYLILEEENEDENEDKETKEERRNMLEQVSQVVHEVTKTALDKEDTSRKSSVKGSDKSSQKLRKRKSTAKSGGDKSHHKTENKELEPTGKRGRLGGRGKNIEKVEVGKVKWSVFLTYAASIGVAITSVWLVLLISVQFASVLSSIWLSVWSEDPLITNATLVDTPQYKDKTDLYLGVYGAFGAAQAILVFTVSIVTAIASIRAARKLHNDMLMNILHAPMWFFDITPIGRIINRFARDVATVDNTLPEQIKGWMNMLFNTLSTFIVISYSTPIFLSVIAPILVVYYFVQDFYIRTTRQLKRIESITRSPIFVHFSESVTGASTIRAYGVQKQFTEHSDNSVDHNLKFFYAGAIANRWLSFRLDFLGSLVVFSAAMFSVVGRDSISGGLVGLSITYALQVTRNLGFLVRQSNEVEINVVSVERMKEYCETANEADWDIEESRPAENWPFEGRVTLEGYSTQYRPGLNMVLKDITVDIRAQEKVGVVGRTGAGKSSMALSLFRLIEASSGSIIIDGINIGTLGLHQLRSKITILPQDPILFSGTLRMNLDPFDQYTDDIIWAALEQAHLKTFISSLNAGLQYECIEGGQNLSVGQRQLVCLARTLLRKTKILILDEATAAVDLETDDVIQNTIRTEFADCTVITIAHRINTIMDNDRVMVLDNGKIQEFDKPSVLLEDKNSIFYSMAKDAGIGLPS